MKHHPSSKSRWIPLIGSVPLFLGAAWLVGCGGGNTGTGGTNTNPTPAPGGNRTFYSKFNSVLVGNNNLVDVARGFVTLKPNSNVPVAVGIELTAKAVTDLPKPQNFDSPVIYGINLPAESIYTPYTYVAISYWSAHNPRGTGDIPHFHPLFGMDPPQAPSAECGSIPIPANCADESVNVAAPEVPQDYINAALVPAAGDDAIAPGIGLAYEDVVLPQPQLVPGWNSIGQNYFFYKGHMNGVGLAATNDYLLKQEKKSAPPVPPAVNIMKQPALYPKAGYYPHRYDVTYDPSRKVHIISLSDFRLVTSAQVAPADAPALASTSAASKAPKAVICVPSTRPLPHNRPIVWGPDGAPVKR
ncbi:hypothetical protein IAD21_06129 [Abditibacteriota bacterium]|nr:hypothetical protein IAD21_06129 [Abditibacteriota bacterium]